MNLLFVSDFKGEKNGFSWSQKKFTCNVVQQVLYFSFLDIFIYQMDSINKRK